jgi:1-acyl-sn-glycerol-3-phosphate acyltransferase
VELLRAGELFGFYPEGTRSPDGRLYRGRSGIGWLALNSGAPVIPVELSGQEYAHLYASDVKTRLAAGGDGD